MANQNDLSDLGIVLYAQTTGDAADVVYDAGARPVVVRRLSASNWIASDWFQVGSLPITSLTVGGTISTNLGSVKVRLEAQRRDSENASLWRPSLVDTIRTDQPSNPPAYEQTIAKADLLHGTGAGTSQVSDWDGSAGGAAAAAELLDVRLMTTDAILTGKCRVLLLCVGSPDPGDKIYVAVNRG